MPAGLGRSFARHTQLNSRLRSHLTTLLHARSDQDGDVDISGRYFNGERVQESDVSLQPGCHPLSGFN